jgi:L-lactate utilization protein LutC
MESSRQTILDRLAASTGASPAAFEPPKPLPGIQGAGAATPAPLIDRLTQAFDRLSVTWEIAETPIVARLKLVSGLKEAGVRLLLTWSAECLPVSGILEALDVLDIRALMPDLRAAPVKLRPQDPAGRAELLARIDKAEIGLTGADAAIAEMGTLFLAHGPGRPLLVSQLPRRHVVLLPASRAYPTLESWLAIERRPARLTALTGIGRSSDIELHPSVGVHGPRERHVIVVMGM